MSGAPDFGKRLQSAVTRAKLARNRLDRLMLNIIRDARADDALIDLRFSLDALEKIATEAAT